MKKIYKLTILSIILFLLMAPWACKKKGVKEPISDNASYTLESKDKEYVLQFYEDQKINELYELLAIAKDSTKDKDFVIQAGKQIENYFLERDSALVFIEKEYRPQQKEYQLKNFSYSDSLKWEGDSIANGKIRFTTDDSLRYMKVHLKKSLNAKNIPQYKFYVVQIKKDSF